MCRPEQCQFFGGPKPDQRAQRMQQADNAAAAEQLLPFDWDLKNARGVRG